MSAQPKRETAVPLADPVEVLTNPTYEMLTQAIGHLEDKLLLAKAALEGVRQSDPGFTVAYLKHVTETSTLEMRIAALQAYRAQQASIAYLGIVAAMVADHHRKATSVDAG